MRIALIVFLLLVSLYGLTWGGSVASISVEAPVRSSFVGDQWAAEQYWALYPDVAANPTYGVSAGAGGAWLHWTCCGQYEGRTWPGTQGTVNAIMTACGYQPKNGFNCVYFPNGARLGAIAWQSVVKTGGSEILSALFLNDAPILRAHHLGVSERTKIISLPEPIDIPIGGTLWAYADGSGQDHPAGFEVQATLYLLGTPVFEYR